jgi:hypothetical protein
MADDARLPPVTSATTTRPACHLRPTQDILAPAASAGKPFGGYCAATGGRMRALVYLRLRKIALPPARVGGTA